MPKDTPAAPTVGARYDTEHELFRDTVRRFIAAEVSPHLDEWEHTRLVDREIFRKAGALGLLGLGAPAEYDGSGTDDFRFNAVIGEEFGAALATGAGLGIILHTDIVAPYLYEFATTEQQRRWLPGTVSGDRVLAIAMTEPGTGSDLTGIRTTAVRHGDYYIVNGAKTFISSGQHADLVVTVARTGDHPHRGLSLLVLERDMPGFERGRNLHKIGLHSQDTSELFFTNVRVPAANLLGDEGDGFYALVRNLPQERMSIAIGALATAESVFAHTLAYASNRTAFEQPIGSFQHNRFQLADIVTELDLTRTFINDCVAQHVHGELSPVRAAKAKLWTTELQSRIADRCLQLHGGYGYTLEYPVSRAFVDARAQRIYGGTNEIMKEVIGRDLGL